MFIPETWILDSISMAVQDYILPIGGFSLTVPATDMGVPETASIAPSGTYKLAHDDLLWLDPSQGDEDYYTSVKRRLAGFDSGQDFDPTKIIVPAVIESPNDTVTKLDYKTGRIFKSGTVVEPVRVSYSHKIARTLTSWPETPEEIRLPTVAINSSQFYGSQFALGSEKNNNQYLYFVEVWAGNHTQRSWICSLLEQALRVDLPLINFGIAYPLISGGQRNPAFNPVTQRVCWLKIEKCRFAFLPVLDRNNRLERARASGTLIVSLIL